VAVLFLMPGLFVFHTKKNLQPESEQKLDNFALVILSIGYSSIISIILSLIFAYLIQYYQVFDLQALITSPKNTITNNSIIFLWLSLGWVLSSLILAYIIGVHDPYEKIVKSKQREALVFSQDVWYGLLNGKNAIVTAHMKNNDRYYGYLDKLEMIPRNDGNRTFILKNVSYVNKNSPKNAYLGDGSFVILDTIDINSFEAKIYSVDTEDIQPTIKKFPGPP